MKPDTFDNPLLFPVIRIITDILEKECNETTRRNIGHFIVEFNTNLAPITTLNATYKFKLKILEYIKQDFLSSLEYKHHTRFIELNLYTHLRNYVMGKCRHKAKELINSRMLEKKSLKQTKINLELWKNYKD